MAQWIIAVAMLAWLMVGRVQAQPAITILSEDYHPGSWTEPDGTMHGKAMDAISAIMQRAAIPYVQRILPWQRVYDQVLKTPDACAFGVALTDERRGLFKWARPLGYNDVSLYAIKGSRLTITSVDDARRLGLVVGVELDDISELLLKNSGVKLESVANRAFNIKKLAAGRIDLWATGPLSAEFAKKKLGITVVPLLKFASVEVGIACNEGTASAVVVNIQRALDQLRADGSLDAIWADRRGAGGVSE